MVKQMMLDAFAAIESTKKVIMESKISKSRGKIKRSCVFCSLQQLTLYLESLTRFRIQIMKFQVSLLPPPMNGKKLSFVGADASILWMKF